MGGGAVLFLQYVWIVLPSLRVTVMHMNARWKRKKIDFCCWLQDLVAGKTRSVGVAFVVVFPPLQGFSSGFRYTAGERTSHTKLVVNNCWSSAVSVKAGQLSEHLVAAAETQWAHKGKWTCLFCPTTTAQRSSFSLSQNCCWRPMTPAGVRTSGKTR